MSNPFQVGDVVECIRSGSTCLRKGELYVVHRDTSSFVYIDGLSGGWDYDRFRLVQRSSGAKPDFFSILAQDSSVLVAVLALLKAQGFTWLVPPVVPETSLISIDVDAANKKILLRCNVKKDGYNAATQFDLIVKRINAPRNQYYEVQLNDNYKALVFRDKIEVPDFGVFDPTVIDTLYKAHQTVYAQSCVAPQAKCVINTRGDLVLNKAMQALVHEYGFVWRSNEVTRAKEILEYNVKGLELRLDKKILAATNDMFGSLDAVNDFEKIIKYISTRNTPVQPIYVELFTGKVAKVHVDCIVVDCQKFPVSVISELKVAIAKHNN
jgi:hypothetical protein